MQFYLKDNGGRRSGNERRAIMDTFFVPEKRHGSDRRQIIDRRDIPLTPLAPYKERRRVFSK
ncbi:MAG: hypothetical protein QNI92_05855 [Desulfobacterales bacterium]|nr:hypothetical protein [Desulfobacterales bacterium]